MKNRVHKLSPLRALKNESGAALLMALFSVMMLLVIATEVMYQTTVEAKVSSQAVNQVKAYYAAKAGVEIGLFRVFLYRKITSSLGDQVPKEMKSQLDLIWTFPFSWPPEAGENLGMATRDQIQKSVKSSLMQASYTLTIESEGSKIDINDLASQSEVVAKATRDQILQILEKESENNEEFAELNRGANFEKIVNAMKDWIDEDKQGTGGGDESGPYRDLNNPEIPPNQPFKTIGEINMVDGVNDSIFAVLAPRITVYGTKGINVNHASKEVLMSLDRTINEERANKIIEARNDPKRGPFTDLPDFVGLLRSLGVDTTGITENDKDAKIPLIFEEEFNFRIKAVGKSGPVLKEIQAITYDYDAVKGRLAEFLKPSPTPGQSATPTPSPTASPTAAAKKEVPNSRPNVVYWGEN